MVEHWNGLPRRAEEAFKSRVDVALGAWFSGGLGSAEAELRQRWPSGGSRPVPVTPARALCCLPSAPSPASLSPRPIKSALCSRPAHPLAEAAPPELPPWRRGGRALQDGRRAGRRARPVHPLLPPAARRLHRRAPAASAAPPEHLRLLLLSPSRTQRRPGGIAGGLQAAARGVGGQRRPCWPFPLLHPFLLGFSGPGCAGFGPAALAVSAKDGGRARSIPLRRGKGQEGLEGAGGSGAAGEREPRPGLGVSPGERPHPASCLSLPGHLSSSSKGKSRLEEKRGSTAKN